MADIASTTIRILSTFDAAGIQAAQEGISAIGAESEGLAATVGGAFSSIGSSLQSAGGQMQQTGMGMTTGLTLPIVGGLAAAGKAFTDFQQQLELAHTQAGATQEQVDAMGKSILALSGQVGQTPEELAKGFYHLASVGLEGKDALDALTAAANGAAVGNASLEDVTNALSATLVSHIGGVKDAASAMAILNATVGAGNMRMQDLVQSFSSGILPSAEAFGLKIQDVAASLSTLTDAGVPAVDAATRLRMMFSLLGAPSKAAVDALDGIGISSTRLADDMRSHGLSFALEDLETHLKDSGKTASQQAEVISRAFGGGRESSTVITLLENLDRLNSKYVQIDATSNNFAQDVADTHTTAAFKFKDALAQVQASLIQLGQAIIPTVTAILAQMVGVLGRVTAWWQSLNPHMQETIVKGALIVAAIGPVIFILGSLITSLGVLFSTLGSVITIGGAFIGFIFSVPGAILLAVVAVAALAYETYTHWNLVKQYTADLVAKIVELFSNLPYKLGVLTGETMKAIALELWHLPGQVEDMFKAAYSAWKAGWDGFKSSGLSAVEDIVKSIGDAFKKLPGEIDSSIKSVTKTGEADVGNYFKGVAHGLGIPGFASGVKNFGGGMAVVGEQGPELVNLPKGASVYPNGSAPSGGGDVHVHIHGPLMVNDDQMLETLADRIAVNIGMRSRQFLNGTF